MYIFFLRFLCIENHVYVYVAGKGSIDIGCLYCTTKAMRSSMVYDTRAVFLNSLQASPLLTALPRKVKI